MKRFIPVAAAVVCLVAAAQAARAEGSFKLYAMAAYVSPLSETEQNVGGVTQAIKASQEFGFNFGAEFRASPLLGIELDYLYAKHEVEGSSAGVLGETTFQPISATLNFHLPAGMLDVYGGPTLAYVNWGDLEIPSSPTVEIDPETAFGLSVGADIGMAPAFAITGGLRWLSLKAQPQGGGSVDVNPLFARIGLAAKF
jgi:outer membrane protein W